MPGLYQSELLRSLGWAIANSLWQMSLLWLVYQMIIGPMFRRKSEVRHLAAFSLLVAGTAWFLFSFVRRLVRQESLESGLVASTPQAISISNYLVNLLPYFSFAYLAVLLLLLIRLFYNVISVQRLRVDLMPAFEWQSAVNRLSVQMGLPKDIFIYFSQQVLVPSTLGYLKPIILLPVASINQLSTEQMEAVILHEMAHIRRNDYLINLIVAFIEALLFFNPFAHLLAKAIRKECELCCDDDVLSRKQDPRQYAEALLLLEKARIQPLLALAATGKQSLLLGRVKRILNVPEHDPGYRNRLAALALVAALLMVAALLTPVTSSSEQVKKNQFVQAEKLQSLALRPIQAIPLKKGLAIAPIKPAKTAKQKPASPSISSAIQEAPVPVPPTPPVPATNPEYLHTPPTPEAPEPTASAPDPRDRRSPDILRDGSRDFAVHSDLLNIAKDGFTLEKMIEAEKRIKIAGGYPIQELADMEQFIFIQAPQEQSRVRNSQAESVKDVRKTLEQVFSNPNTRATLKRGATAPKASVITNDEMTIHIIQDESHIEITVKGRK